MNAKQFAAVQAFDIAAAKTGELVEFYNAHAEAPVKKFADRKTAERRVSELVAAIVAARAEKVEKAGKKAEGVARGSKKAEREAEAARRLAAAKKGHCPQCGSKSDITHGRIVERGGKQHEVDMHVATCHSCGHDFNHETGKPAKYSGSGERSEAISKSWADPDVHARRVTRHKVKVNGVEYPSLYQAFVALGLPVSKLIKFRLELKASGKQKFEGNAFVLIAKE